jgi:hypothetical protein
MKLFPEDFDEESRAAIKRAFWEGLFFGTLIVAPIVYAIAAYVITHPR